MMRREPIPELVGQVITKADYVDEEAWFEIEITTNDGRTITVGGYKSDASAILQLGGTTTRSWPW